MKLPKGNPMTSVLLSVLIFEIIVIWLAFAGILQISDVGIAQAALWAGVATVLTLLGCVGLKRGWGYLFGWLAQVAVLGLGLLTPWMFAMGIIFALIWIITFILGKRLDARKREHEETQ